MRDIAEGRSNVAGERKVDYLEEVGRSMVVQSFIFFFEGACSIYACFRKYTHYSPRQPEMCILSLDVKAFSLDVLA